MKKKVEGITTFGLNFGFTVMKIFLEVPFCALEKFWCRKNIQIGGGGANITIYRHKILSHSTQKLRRGTLVCFRKFLVTKKYMHKRGGGIITFLCRKVFLTLPINFVGEPFCISEKLSYRKVLWIRGRRERGYHNFPLKICCLPLPRNFVGKRFYV